MEKKFLGIGTVGERGQIAIPADARKFCDIQSGEKMVFFSLGQKMGFMAVKADQISSMFDKIVQKKNDIEKMIKKHEQSEAPSRKRK